MNLHPVRSAQAFQTEKELQCNPELQWSTLRSEKCWQNAEKIDEEKITQGRGTTETQRSSPCRKIVKEGQEVCSEGGKQVILMHIAFS